MTGDSDSVSSGVRWTYFSTIASGLLQILLLALTARLVSSEDFGILTTALLVLKAFQVLIQSGYERAVIWAEDPDQACLSGLFWVSILTGVLVTAIIMALSGAIGTFFSEPRLQEALIMLAPMALLASPGLIPRGILRRSMRFRALSIYELACYILAFAGMGLPLALAGLGLWALVAANLLQCLLQGGLALILAPPPAFTRFGWNDIRGPLRFGFSVSGLGIVEFIDQQATQIFIGRTFGMSSLGVYNRSNVLIQMPLEQMGTSLTRVLFSHFSRAKGNQAQLRQVIETPVRLLAILVLPIAFGGGAVAETVTEVMLGAGWENAGPIFRALCIGTAAAVLGHVLATLNEALTLIRQKMMAQLLITGSLISLLAGFGGQGVVEVASCFSFTRVLFLCAQIWLAAPHLGLRWPQLAAMLLPGFALALVIAGLLFETDQFLQSLAVGAGFRLLALLVVGGLGTCAGALIVAPEGRRLLRRRGQKE